MPPFLRTSPEEISANDILDRILEGCIAFDPTTRILLVKTDFVRERPRVIVARERRRHPFRIPPNSAAAR